MISVQKQAAFENLPLAQNTNFTLDELMTLESVLNTGLNYSRRLSCVALHERATSGTFTKDESASFRNAI